MTITVTYSPLPAAARRWCHVTPPELLAEALTDSTYAYYARLGLTVTATPTTFTITDPLPSSASLPVLMEATMSPDGIYWGNMWILPSACAEPSMTILALTIHRTLNPPDVSEEILFYGAHGNWMNFMRFTYSVSDTWARKHELS